MEKGSKAKPSKQQGRPKWVSPKLKRVGNVGDVLQGGGGKLSIVSQDPGDTRKPSGGG